MKKMKTLVAEDGLAPSAYRQVNCDLYHVAPPRLDRAGIAEFERLEKQEIMKREMNW